MHLLILANNNKNDDLTKKPTAYQHNSGGQGVDVCKPPEYLSDLVISCILTGRINVHNIDLKKVF